MTAKVNADSHFVQREFLVENSVLTNRNRYALWVAMGMLEDEIGMDLDNRVPYDESLTFGDFPPCAKAQTEDWWRSVEDSARRLWECLRTGDDIVLQNVAEEVVLRIAAGKRVLEVIEYLDMDGDYVALPINDNDINVGLVRVADLYEEIGEDADAEYLWDPSTANTLDPVYYAPANWFRSFR